MKLPVRQSLFWKLSALLVACCLLMIWISRSWGEHLERERYKLSAHAQAALIAFSEEAEHAWFRGGIAGLDDWLTQFRQREKGWATVVSSDLHALSSQRVTREDRRFLTFMRRVDWPMSNRSRERPAVSIPFPDAPDVGQLVMQVPERFMPGKWSFVMDVVAHNIVPGMIALLLGGLLYRLLIGPLAHLRRQANALRGDQLSTRVDPSVTCRGDEFGELGRAFDHMADRLEHTVTHQKRLLGDLSHELRTPLSRLQVALDDEHDDRALRARLALELAGMRRLVDDTLELVWLDNERPRLALEPVEVVPLWELIAENACYESGWEPARIRCELPADCWVQGNLNGLAKALENILRNAVRHSSGQGSVTLGGRLSDGHWHLWIDDQGPGVAPDALERIFLPFTRLNAARPDGEGFGLGLAIARQTVHLQGGRLWADNLNPGLRLNLRLPAIME